VKPISVVVVTTMAFCAGLYIGNTSDSEIEEIARGCFGDLMRCTWTLEESLDINRACMESFLDGMEIPEEDRISL